MHYPLRAGHDSLVVTVARASVAHHAAVAGDAYVAAGAVVAVVDDDVVVVVEGSHVDLNGVSKVVN